MRQRILITGARSIDDLGAVYAHCDLLLGAAEDFPRVGVILSGGQVGVDRILESYARDNEIPFILIKPYHLVDAKAEHSTRHYFVRNKMMVDNSDWVIAFSDGVDAGTEDVINYTRKRGKALTIIDRNQLNSVGGDNG